MVLFTLKRKRCQIYVSKLENQRSLGALQISLSCAACLFLTSWFLLSILMLELVWLECSWYRQPWMQSPSWTTWKLVQSGYRCTTWLHAESIFSSISCSPSLHLYLSGKRCLLSIPIHGGLCGQLFIFHIQQCFDGKPWGLHVRKPQGYPECKWWQPQSEWSVSPCQTESLWVFCPKVPILSPISMWSASQHIGMRLQFDSVDSKHSSNWLNWLNWYCSWLKSTNFSKEPSTSSSGGQNHP